MYKLANLRPNVDVLGLEVTNAERGTRFVFNRRQPLVGLRDDFRHPGHGTATVIDECEVFRICLGKFWKLQIRNVGVCD